MAKVTRLVGTNKWIFHCPACGCGHFFETPRWSWNENADCPSVTPSISVNGPHGKCHFHITAGNFHYTAGSEHSLKTDVVPMTDF